MLAERRKLCELGSAEFDRRRRNPTCSAPEGVRGLSPPVWNFTNPQRQNRWGSAPYPARNLFAKRFLDFQKTSKQSSPGYKKIFKNRFTNNTPAPGRGGINRGLRLNMIQRRINYLMISETTPEPTVRPPSRIAKRRPFSQAMGAISSTVISTLSPGRHISTPAGSSMTPVTSVVLK